MNVRPRGSNLYVFMSRHDFNCDVTFGEYWPSFQYYAAKRKECMVQFDSEREEYWGMPNAAFDELSVLAAAVYYSRYDLVKYLLESGEDPNTVTRVHRIPCLWLAKDDRMFQLLISYKADYYAVFSWIRHNSIGISTLNDNESNLYLDVIKPWVVELRTRFLQQLHNSIGCTPKVFQSLHLFGWDFELSQEMRLVKNKFYQDRERQKDTLYCIVLDNLDVEPDIIKLLNQHHQIYREDNPVRIYEVFYQLLVEKNHVCAFEILLSGIGENASLLLAHCYLNQLGCDRDYQQAMTYLERAFTYDTDLLYKARVVTLFENMPAPHNLTQQYHSNLARLLEKMQRYPEAMMQYTLAGELTPEVHGRILYMKSLSHHESSAAHLLALHSAAIAGNLNASVALRNIYIGESPEYGVKRRDYRKAVYYGYLAGQQGYVYADWSLDWIQNHCREDNSTSAQDKKEISTLARMKTIELQFLRCMAGQDACMEGAEEFPLLACVMRECLTRDGIFVKELANYVFTKELQVRCQENYLAASEEMSFYAHFLFAGMLTTPGIVRALFANKVDRLLMTILHIAAAKLLYENSDPHVNLVMRNVDTKLNFIWQDLQNDTTIEIKQSVDYIHNYILGKKPATLPAPALLGKLLAENSFPLCLRDRFNDARLSAAVQKADTQDLFAYLQQSKALRQNRRALCFVQQRSSGSGIGLTGAEGLEAKPRSHSF